MLITHEMYPATGGELRFASADGADLQLHVRENNSDVTVSLNADEVGELFDTLGAAVNLIDIAKPEDSADE